MASIADLLKTDEEKELLYTPMDAGVTPPSAPESIIPDNTPQEQVFTAPKLEDILPPKKEDSDIAKAIQEPQVPMVAEISPLSRQEQLLKDYLELSGKELKSARESDRMLKMGGAIGDALATYINARSQMKSKIPGVQVQQGAGLGKIADMFATSPEIQSDVADRRKALLEQYKQLVSGEESKLDRALKERQIAAYESQTRAQSKKAELDAAKERQKETSKLTVGEETLDREFAKEYKNWSTKGKAEYEENSKILKDAIKQLGEGKVSTGFTEGIGARLPGVRTETRELETRVRKALNGMLRATLGAQFTQEEGERIFQQTFDPAADPKENIKNMETELNKLEKQKRLIEDQGNYFKQKSTLRGYDIPETLERSEESLQKKTSTRKEIRQGDNIFDADTKEFIRKAP